MFCLEFFFFFFEIFLGKKIISHQKHFYIKKEKLSSEKKYILIKFFLLSYEKCFFSCLNFLIQQLFFCWELFFFSSETFFR